MSDSPNLSLQQREAIDRFECLSINSYDVVLDLAGHDDTFTSRTTIDFDSTGGATFVDVKPVHVREVRLNDAVVDPAALSRGRLPLTPHPGRNVLVVDAVMGFRKDGEGLHRSVDPADGRHYVYGMSFLDAAPSIFACFDQPDLKAAYTFHVRAPQTWTVIGNAPGVEVEPGVWEFETTQPLSTYFVTLVAGPWHVIRDEHDGIPLGLSVRASMAADLDKDAEQLFTITRQCFDEFHRLFGIRYPFGDYHQAFVPEFNAGAMENPGCVTFRDQLIFSSRVTRGLRIARATTVAHEMAHQWFGNIVTPKWWDDLWLNESFAEYMGNRVVADVTEYDDVWTDNSYARRQWGLVADQRASTHPVAGTGAVDASAALQDFDGISYAKGSAILKQLNATLGDEIFFAGAIDHFDRHRFGNATMHDLFASWERAGAGDLSDFTDNWLRKAGADTIVLDRAAAVVRRTSPADHPAERPHTFRAALARNGAWEDRTIVLDSPEVPMGAGTLPVLLDPYNDTWAVLIPDQLTVDGLKTLLPDVADPLLRAGVWNNLRNAFHNAAVDPDDVLDIVEAAVPVEDTEGRILAWVRRSVIPLTRNPVESVSRIHEAARRRVASESSGSEQQLAAFRAQIATSTDATVLKAWRAQQELPPGISLDLDLRWRLLLRLAVLGDTTPDELDDELAAEPTGESQVHHTCAIASLPTAEAKAFAWARFTGEVDVPNYELEAAGTGMWCWGQEELTEPYVQRYFDELPATVQVRAGWMLAEAAEYYFPATSLTDQTLARAHALLSESSLEASMRRRLVDEADQLERMLAVQRDYRS